MKVKCMCALSTRKARMMGPATRTRGPTNDLTCSSHASTPFPSPTSTFQHQHHPIHRQSTTHNKTMASRLLNPNLFHLRTPLLLTTLGVSTGLLLHQHTSLRHALRLDSSPSALSPKDWSFSQYQNDAQTPILNSGGRLNARAVRQMSMGSIFGSSCFPSLPFTHAVNQIS